LNELCSHLDDIWEEHKGDVILFRWTKFLEEETLSFLNIESPLNLNNVIAGHESGLTEEASCRNKSTMPTPCRVYQDIDFPEDLLPSILEYDTQEEEVQFNNTLFSCTVCFQERNGVLCLKFPKCDHIFCRECMKAYFEVQIEDGKVKSLTCPYDKCDSQPLPFQVCLCFSRWP